MEPWISLTAASVLTTVAIFSSAKVRSILRAIFRRPRDLSLIVRGPDGRQAVLEIKGTKASPEELDALIKATFEGIRSEPTGDAQAPAGESSRRATGGDSDD
ncbi:hypothetical protein [Streptomyces sp. NPDC051452]|uniref:hypothetical protein n=1 Tax=Streptomyces sp. NPDC051452 TaxID=3365654 RepID=UPI0037ACFC2D